MVFSFFKRKKKIGLALGGGALRGFAHIGMLEAIDEFGIKISGIAGTSIGALIGVLYASGMSPVQMEERFSRFSWFSVMTPSFSLKGISGNTKVSGLIPREIKTFDQLKIPVAAVCTNLGNGKKVVLSEGNVRRAIEASTAIPGIYLPVKVGESYLVDGYIVSNLPVDDAKDLGMDFVIAANLTPVAELLEPPDSFLEIFSWSRDLSVMQQLDNQTQPDIMLQLIKDYEPSFLYKRDFSRRLIRMGYLIAKKELTANLKLLQSIGGVE